MKKFIVTAKAVEYYEEEIILGHENTKENAISVFETIHPRMDFIDIEVQEIEDE